MKSAALIVATGRTAHHDQLDPYVQVGAVSAAQRLIMTFHLADITPVVVMVSREESAREERHAARMGAVFLTAAHADAEMFDHVRAGLTYLAGKCHRVFVTPVDVPLFSVETLQAMLASRADLAVPTCGGKRGHPLMINEALFPAILGYGGEGGLRGAVRATGLEVVEIGVQDTGVLPGFPQDTVHGDPVQERPRNKWRPSMKLQIARESAFLGPGTRQLLLQIDRTGSVRMACEQMGMSYSKAWKLLNGLEEQLEYAVVDRKKGGRSGGETRLTPDGVELLARFDAFERECRACVDTIFEKHFGNL